jgi:hypothetical protein
MILLAMLIIGCSDQLGIGKSSGYSFPTTITQSGQRVVYVGVGDFNKVIDSGKIVSIASYSGTQYGTTGYIIVFEK